MLPSPKRLLILHSNPYLAVSIPLPGARFLQETAMDSDHVRQPHYFSVSVMNGRLFPHQGQYLPEDKLDAMLRTWAGNRKIRSSGELDEALSTSRGRSGCAVTLDSERMEDEVGRRQRRAGEE